MNGRSGPTVLGWHFDGSGISGRDPAGDRCGDWNDAKISGSLRQGLAAAKKTRSPSCCLSLPMVPALHQLHKLFHDDKVSLSAGCHDSPRQGQERRLARNMRPTAVHSATLLSELGRHLDEGFTLRHRVQYFYDERNPAPLLAEWMRTEEAPLTAAGTQAKRFLITAFHRRTRHGG